MKSIEVGLPNAGVGDTKVADRSSTYHPGEQCDPIGNSFEEEEQEIEGKKGEIKELQCTADDDSDHEDG